MSTSVELAWSLYSTEAKRHGLSFMEGSKSLRNRPTQGSLRKTKWISLALRKAQDEKKTQDKQNVFLEGYIFHTDDTFQFHVRRTDKKKKNRDRGVSYSRGIGRKRRGGNVFIGKNGEQEGEEDRKKIGLKWERETERDRKTERKDQKERELWQRVWVRFEKLAASVRLCQAATTVSSRLPQPPFVSRLAIRTIFISRQHTATFGGFSPTEKIYTLLLKRTSQLNNGEMKASWENQ